MSATPPWQVISMPDLAECRSPTLTSLKPRSHEAGERTRVAIVLQKTARALEVAAVWEAFNSQRSSKDGAPVFDVDFASVAPGVPVPTFGTATLAPTCSLEWARTASMIFLAPPVSVPAASDPELLQTLKDAFDAGSHIMAVDTSVFTLAETGLLHDQSATTHWSLAKEFRARFPQIVLTSHTPYIDGGRILTAAGGAATVDLCMSVVTRGLGPRLEADQVVGALRLVRTPPVGDVSDEVISELMRWIDQNLEQDLSAEVLCTRAFISRRSLSRRFRAAVQCTPHAWILQRRLERACELLRQPSNMSVSEVAARTGFRQSAVLRQHFRRTLGCSPTEYRRTHALNMPNDSTETDGS